nr:aminodeoxychorismate lyase [Actinomycetales bacterium]
MTDLFDVGLSEEGPRRSRRERREEAARKSRRRSQRGRTVVAVLVSLVILGVAVAFVLPVVRGFLDGDAAPEDYAGPGTGSVMVEIPAGSSGAAIGSILADADVVATQGAFVSAYNADPNSTSIQAGFYNLQLQMPAADVITALHDRASRAEISVTVPEGVRAATIYQRIATALDIPVEDVQAAAADTASYGLPEEAGGNPEGWLGAQTYIVPPNSDTTSILRLMVQETVQTLEALSIPPEE